MYTLRNYKLATFTLYITTYKYKCNTNRILFSSLNIKIQLYISRVSFINIVTDQSCLIGVSTERSMDENIVISTCYK